MSGTPAIKAETNLTPEVKEMNIKEVTESAPSTFRSTSAVADEQAQTGTASPYTAQRKVKQMPGSPATLTTASQSLDTKGGQEVTIGGDITVKVEPGKAPKLTRKMSQKVIAKPRALFTHLDDSTEEAKSTFELMSDCHYAAKHLGSTEQALECDCTEEWGTYTTGRAFYSSSYQQTADDNICRS